MNLPKTDTVFNSDQTVGANGLNQEVINFLESDGFVHKDNSSYSEVDRSEKCYEKYICLQDGWLDITMFVTELGIIVDQDYDCGGNMSTWNVAYDGRDFSIAWMEALDFIRETLKD